MCCISKIIADMGKLALILESAGQIYPETSLTFEAAKCVLENNYLMCAFIINLMTQFMS
jgi:hypothetical protein